VRGSVMVPEASLNKSTFYSGMSLYIPLNPILAVSSV
jgi:hypothetical protein